LLHPGAPIDMDGAEYARVAENLRHGQGLVGLRGSPMLLFPPLYSLLIAAASIVTPSYQAAGLLVSIVAGSALVFPVYGIAVQLYGQRAALYAALLAATLPFLVEFSAAVISEELFAVVTLGGIFYTLRAMRDARFADAALAGLCLSFGYLTRPEGILFGGIAFGALFVAAVFARMQRPARLLGVLLFAATLVLAAMPYLLWAAHVSGHFALERKTAINYAIGTRLARGMTYEQAANEITPDLQEIGPEISPRYNSASYVVPPTIGQQVRFAVAATRAHALTMLRLLVARPAGSIVLVTLAIVGLCGGTWTRRRAGGEMLLAACFIANAMALASVWQYWPRYGAFFLPFSVIWAGHGIELVRSRVNLFGRMTGATIAGALLAIVFASAYVNALASVVPNSEREAGEWLRTQGGLPHAIVMETTDLTAYYSENIWRPLPYAGSQLALRYIAKIRPQYIVVTAADQSTRPYLEQWRAHGIPSREAVPVLHLHPGTSDELILYRWGRL
jgi:4-amino-4-deoxy-L-arabinose transferase-like glycosyltransferase